jgi:hypothetical protein
MSLPSGTKLGPYEISGMLGGGLDLVLLVDSTVTSNIANRRTELQDFLHSQPGSALEGIAYGQFGEARFEQELTADHDTAAKALRMPAANAGRKPSSDLKAVCSRKRPKPQAN